MTKIIRNYLTKNFHYKKNKVIPVERLVLHSVGCPQPDPNVFVRSWDSSTAKYVTQLVIGTTQVIEVLPCLQTKGKAVKCYHVGKANYNSIGAEMTEPSTIKYTGGSNWVDLNPSKTKAHVLATYEKAVDTFAQLCIFHGLNPLKDGVILSHRECYKRGIGTNHGDVEHIWSKFGLTMNQFRKDVKAQVDALTTKTSFDILAEKGVINTPEYWESVQNQLPYLPKLLDSLAKFTTPEKSYDFKTVEEALSHLAECKVINTPEYWLNNHSKVAWLDQLLIKSANHTPKAVKSSFQVTVSISTLNMRTGPDKSFDRIGYIKKGVYTIVEVSGKWGRLKSKQTYNGKPVDAWIHLDYTTKA